MAAVPGCSLRAEAVEAAAGAVVAAALSAASRTAVAATACALVVVVVVVALPLRSPFAARAVGASRAEEEEEACTATREVAEEGLRSHKGLGRARRPLPVAAAVAAVPMRRGEGRMEVAGGWSDGKGEHTLGGEQALRWPTAVAEEEARREGVED